MIKKLKVRGKDIPVPVPIKTLKEAISWVHDALAKKENTITSIMFSGREILQDWESGSLKDQVLSDGNDLEFQVDNPRDLSVQTLDAVRDLSYQIEKRLQEIAVRCWRSENDMHFQQVDEILQDLNLTLDLIAHINGIIDYSHPEMGPMNALSGLVRRAITHIEEAKKEGDWKRCAELLLKRLDPWLKEMVAETENLQLVVLTASIHDFESSIAART